MKFKEYLKILEREGFDDIDQPFEKDEPKEGEQYYFGEEDEDEVYNKTKDDDFHYEDDDEDDEDEEDEEDFSPEELDELRKRIYSGLDDKEESGIKDINNVLKNYGTKVEDDDEDVEEEEVELTEEEEEAYDNLAYTIRKMIAGSKISDFNVYRDGYDFSVQFVLSKKERLGHILHIMGVMKKIASDILIQYDAEIDLWETKKGEPLLSLDFWLNPKKSTSEKQSDFGLPF